MKYAKLFIITALLVAPLYGLFSPVPVQALSTAQQKTCVNNWDGKMISNPDKYPTKTNSGAQKDYLNGNCDESQGGNCHKQTIVTSDSKQAQIVCAAPDASTSGVGTIPSAADPATQYKACKDAEHCNLIKNYLNPIINKFLAPFAMLAVIIGIIWGAIQFSTSAGDPQKAAAGKAHIQKSLIGLVSFLLLYGILNWLIPGGLLP